MASREDISSTGLTRVYAGLVPHGSAINGGSLRKVTAATPKVELTGIATVWRQIVKHPETGQDVAVVAVLWSPAGAAAAKIMNDKMSAAEHAPSSTATDAAPVEAGESLVIERPANDRRAF